MIKFSSQVDIHMPGFAKINVKHGDKVQAGVTVIASK
jgi:phosphatidylserine decarboxylase